MFKVGDRVLVVKKYEGAIYWHPAMDKYIGHTGIIYSIGRQDIKIDFDNIKQDAYESVGQSHWYFPIESIIKIGQMQFEFMYD